MVISREDLRQQLKRRAISPVYVLFGQETYLRDLAARTIADLAFAEGDFRDFNDSTFSLNTEGNLQRALAAAEQLPMMSSRRVVRITDVRISATGHRDTITDENEAALAEYFKDPSSDAVVIFVADELNGNRKIGKFLRSAGVAVDFTPLDDRQFADWARRQVRDVGAEISEPTLQMLIRQVGPDVRRLSNEINKLATGVLPGRTIAPEIIEQLVPNSREIRTFDLNDHLSAGRKAEAIKTLQKLLDDGTEPLALLGLIAYNYRRRLVAREATAPSAMGRHADIDVLKRAVQRIAEADLSIKTSKGGGGPAGTKMQIQMLVCELAAMGTPSSR